MLLVLFLTRRSVGDCAVAGDLGVPPRVAVVRGVLRRRRSTLTSNDERLTCTARRTCHRRPSRERDNRISDSAFVAAFAGVSVARSRLGDLQVTIGAALTAHALNVGYVPVISAGVPSLTRGRISHVDQNYLRHRRSHPDANEDHG